MDFFITQYAVADGTRRVARLKNKGGKDINIFFDLVGEKNLPEPIVLDGFVFGIIFYAMRTGESLRVHGVMSAEALYNLAEFQEAWVNLCPEIYRKIEVVPSTVVFPPKEGRAGRALCAFSGGVDSVFTVLRHKTKARGNASYPLEAVVLVHGFNVPLAAKDGFNLLRERVRPFIDELGLELKILRTNLKSLNLMNWEMGYMSQLAACLHNYSHDFCYALVGSSDAYNEFFLPWGSTPATDRLLSGSDMKLVHDGAGFSRTEKVAFLSKQLSAQKVLKVCWEGKDVHKNCGVCEKCVRTHLNFLAVGVENPPCFDDPLDLQKIDAILLRKEMLNDFESVYAYAEKHGVKGEWMDRLKARLDKYSPPSKSRIVLQKVQRRARRLVPLLKSFIRTKSL
jgi:hypothetical protein